MFPTRHALRVAVLATALAAGAAVAGPPEGGRFEAFVCGPEEAGNPCAVVDVSDSAYAGGQGAARVCPQSSTATVCVDEQIGAGTDAPGTAALWPKPHGGLTTRGCSWSGTPGSRVDFGGQTFGVPHPGGRVSVSMRCTLYVNGSYFSHVDGVPWQNGSWAHRRAFPPRGAALKVCLDHASARWSDGHFESFAQAGCHPIHTGTTD